ncbi:Jacalin-like lectin domain-containing protein [Xylaria bambusicola]|uniref:Jacalin-like lectin domain-containing protein n=1 Tax=Xylaria bambusicola TaxID=326684 RepID=UPI0020074C51|nr:Jacalin-like lectin domain-containing protein [Xylaria bambusicola]KAI0521297.1 Jacalin-like lectin domain-containing protein [Xylaria bambusicola]
MVGGDGGQPFRDAERQSNLRQINIRCARRVDSLQCIYADGSSSEKHGGDGGRDEIFALDSDEAIITVWIWSGSEIDAIQFQTTKGRLSPKYGGSGGDPTIFRGHDGTRERALMAFEGRSGDILNSLDPIWSNARELDSEHVAVGDAQGGDGGDPFDMLTTVSNAFPFVLKAIHIRAARTVDAIECVFADIDGREVRTGRQGGDGGDAYVFTLENNERIIRVEGRAEQLIDRLQFFTNKGRASQTYGGDGGHAFVWNPPFSGHDSAADANMSLMCFQGRSARRVDRLAPVWSPDPPVNFALSIDWFEDISSAITSSPETAWTSDQSVVNTTMDNMSAKVVWAMQASKSSTITLSDSSRNKVGGKVAFEVTAKGKRGIPYVAEGEVSVKAGVEASGEKEWGNTATDGKTVSRTYTETIEQTVTVRPSMQLQGRAVAYKVAVHDLKWRGNITVTYAGGGKRTFAVDGTFDSASATKCHTTYETKPL